MDRSECFAPTMAVAAAASVAVEEEYLCAMRTRSYTKLCGQVERQRRVPSDVDEAVSSPDYTLLLEPNQAALAGTTGHRLLLDFFEATLRACAACGLLLDAAHRARADHSALLAATSHAAEALRGFRELRNPFAGGIREELELASAAHDPLARRLMAAHRRAAGLRLWRRRWRTSVVARIAALFGVALVEEGEGEMAAEVGAAAARGAFAVRRDMETMRSMAGMVGDEIEHRREVIGLLVEGGGGEGLMVKEVVRELQERESGFMKQLAELEEHAVLCFVNINRARRMVLQHIIAAHQKTSSNY